LPPTWEGGSERYNAGSVNLVCLSGGREVNYAAPSLRFARNWTTGYKTRPWRNAPTGQKTKPREKTSPPHPHRTRLVKSRKSLRRSPLRYRLASQSRQRFRLIQHRNPVINPCRLDDERLHPMLRAWSEFRAHAAAHKRLTRAALSSRDM